MPRREHCALADFLVELAAFDERALWRQLGHASLFDYLHRTLSAAEEASATLPEVDAAQIVMPGEPGLATPLSLPTPATPAVPSPARDDRPVIEPLTADLARLHITVPRSLLSKLDRARDALSHSKPGATTADILEAALDLLLDRDAKRKGLVAKPQKKLRPAKPDRVRASVLREVWKRDGGRCQYRLANGEICGSTCRVEAHHREARAHGGGHATPRPRPPL
jgi:hypothetical protein